MEHSDNKDFRNVIRDEMVSNHSGALEKNFELAKRFMRITKEGRVDVIVKDMLHLKEQILLYLVGKLYAHEVNFSDAESVSNQELMNELGIQKGSLLPRLKELRDGKKIKRVKVGRYVHHTILLSMIEKTLKEIETKVG